MAAEADQARLAAARQALVAAEAAAGRSDANRSDASASQSNGPEASGSGATRSDASGWDGGGSDGSGSTLSPEAQVRRIVLRQLAMGPRTRAQLEAKLTERGCDPQVGAQVLDRMSEVGLVDDEAYAEMFVRSKQETKGLAVSALRHELRAKGVADEVVDAALEEIDPQAEREQARALVARRLRTMRGVAREVQTRRLAGFLARKGYSAAVSYQVIREALDDLPEHLRD